MYATVEGLSRGVTQLIQFSGAVPHQPDLIILDEPFAGLDTLNVELMKEIIREEQAKYWGVIRINLNVVRLLRNRRQKVWFYCFQASRLEQILRQTKSSHV